MKPWLRNCGIVVFFALLPVPIALGLSANPLLIYPVWAATAYAFFRLLAPAHKRASALPLAILSGDLAWQVFMIMANSGATITSNIQAPFLLAGIFWLYATQSKIPAALLLLEQAAMLTFNLFSIGMVSDLGLGNLGLMLIVTTLTFRAAAILTLTQFLFTKRVAPLAKAAEPEDEEMEEILPAD